MVRVRVGRVALSLVLVAGGVVNLGRSSAAEAAACVGSNAYLVAVCVSAPASLWTFDESNGASVFADSVGTSPAASRTATGVGAGAVGPTFGATLTRGAAIDGSCGAGLVLASPGRFASGPATWELWFRPVISPASLTRGGIFAADSFPLLNLGHFTAEVGFPNSKTGEAQLSALSFASQRNATSSGRGVLALGPWSHIVVTFDGLSVRTFLNGRQPIGDLDGLGTSQRVGSVRATLGLNVEDFATYGCAVANSATGVFGPVAFISECSRSPRLPLICRPLGTRMRSCAISARLRGRRPTGPMGNGLRGARAVQRVLLRL